MGRCLCGACALMFEMVFITRIDSKNFQTLMPTAEYFLNFETSDELAARVFRSMSKILRVHI